MCQYCSMAFNDGWNRLAEYDDVYQAVLAERRREGSERSHGFYEGWDDLRDQVRPSP